MKMLGVVKLIVNPSRVKLYEHLSSFSCNFKSGVEMCEIEKKFMVMLLKNRHRTMYGKSWSFKNSRVHSHMRINKIVQLNVIKLILTMIAMFELCECARKVNSEMATQ